MQVKASYPMRSAQVSTAEIASTDIGARVTVTGPRKVKAGGSEQERNEGQPKGNNKDEQKDRRGIEHQ
jgi:hypothetical protein